ncbi:hypothetical protein P7H50_01560 [Enterococcus durans]|uniref:hypothetical protein n=1 Tax=Enterococcus durans TaxID=53345 RepID=UPI00289086AB|nr:hypothetical protein [Enterococcus durans]MDT2835598.1 hypothetical protein [Enterococcus durans]
MARLFELLFLGIEYFSIGFINGRLLGRGFDKKYFWWLLVAIIASVVLFDNIGILSSVFFGILLLVLSFNSERDKFVAVVTGTISLGMYIFLNYMVGFVLTKLNIYDHLTMGQTLGTVIICYLIIGLLLSAKLKKFCYA